MFMTIYIADILSIMKKPDFKSSVLKGVNQAQSGQMPGARPSLAEMASKIEGDAQPLARKEPPPTPKPKPKAERRQAPTKDAFSCTKDDLHTLDALIKRSKMLGIRASKSEVVRAGIWSLVETTDEEFRAILMNIPQIKTGRPAKKE
jgi:hypothetical protein